MSRIAKSFAVLLCGGATWFAATLTTSMPARAQDALLAEVYGQGVHAYNSGRYQAAVEHLTTAMSSGSKDPRVYYYRGLAYSRMGYGDQAGIDFQTGADLEAKNQGEAFYPVSQSLQRIQGRARLTLEAYRNVARLQARQDALTRNRERYEQIERARPSVTRPGAGAATAPAAGTPAAGGAATDLPVPPPSESDPFADAGAGLGAGEATDAPPKPAGGAAAGPATSPPPPPGITPEGETASEDPFGAESDPETPAEDGAGDDAGESPFGDDPEEPAEEMPAEEDAAEEEPAEEEMPAEEEAAEEEPAAEEPAADEPAEDDDDPFN